MSLHWRSFLALVDCCDNFRIFQICNLIYIGHGNVGSCCVASGELTKECLPECFPLAVERCSGHSFYYIIVNKTILSKSSDLVHLQTIFPHHVLIRSMTPDPFLIQFCQAFPPRNPTPSLASLIKCPFKKLWVIEVEECIADSTNLLICNNAPAMLFQSGVRKHARCAAGTQQGVTQPCDWIQKICFASGRRASEETHCSCHVEISVKNTDLTPAKVYSSCEIDNKRKSWHEYC
mmetsp:Transcript_139146/g.242135  ORF Transcript_139146/g.242135 Transcript_139146/m.242135 type:complete len:234 (-) Transcript_139146:1111-1812(-)